MTRGEVAFAAITIIVLLLMFALAGTNDYQSSVAWQRAWEEQNSAAP